MIRGIGDRSDPVLSLDPIAFISVFAIVLDWLVPRHVVYRYRDKIDEVVDELAGIVVEEDGSSWPYSRKECVERSCKCFWAMSLDHDDIVHKLIRLVHTWHPQWRF